MFTINNLPFHYTGNVYPDSSKQELEANNRQLEQKVAEQLQQNIGL